MFSNLKNKIIDDFRVYFHMRYVGTGTWRIYFSKVLSVRANQYFVFFPRTGTVQYDTLLVPHRQNRKCFFLSFIFSHFFFLVFLLCFQTYKNGFYPVYILHTFNTCTKKLNILNFEKSVPMFEVIVQRYIICRILLYGTVRIDSIFKFNPKLYY